MGAFFWLWLSSHMYLQAAADWLNLGWSRIVSSRKDHSSQCGVSIYNRLALACLQSNQGTFIDNILASKPLVIFLSISEHLPNLLAIVHELMLPFF